MHAAARRVIDLIFILIVSAPRYEHSPRTNAERAIRYVQNWTRPPVDSGSKKPPPVTAGLQRTECVWQPPARYPPPQFCNCSLCSIVAGLPVGSPIVMHKWSDSLAVDLVHRSHCLLRKWRKICSANVFFNLYRPFPSRNSASDFIVHKDPAQGELR